jgi:hypothetical protein
LPARVINQKADPERELPKSRHESWPTGVSLDQQYDDEHE